MNDNIIQQELITKGFIQVKSLLTEEETQVLRLSIIQYFANSANKFNYSHGGLETTNSIFYLKMSVESPHHKQKTSAGFHTK